MENLKVSPESKRGLEWLKEAYGFRTYSICIDTVVQFFKHNKINPRDLLSENYSQTLFEFKKEVFEQFKFLFEKENENTERVIKLTRRIEEDFIKPINKKTIDIHKIVLDYYNEKSNNELVKNIPVDNIKIVTSEADKIKIEELKGRLFKQEKSVKAYKDIVDEQEIKINEYHRCLKTLNKKMKVENGRPYIDLPTKEAEILFYLIPDEE